MKFSNILFCNTYFINFADEFYNNPTDTGYIRGIRHSGGFLT